MLIASIVIDTLEHNPFVNIYTSDNIIKIKNQNYKKIIICSFQITLEIYEELK